MQSSTYQDYQKECVESEHAREIFCLKSTACRVYTRNSVDVDYCTEIITFRVKFSEKNQNLFLTIYTHYHMLYILLPIGIIICVFASILSRVCAAAVAAEAKHNLQG